MNLLKKKNRFFPLLPKLDLCHKNDTLRLDNMILFNLFGMEGVNLLEHSYQVCQLPNIWHLAHQTPKIDHHEVR